MTAVSGSKLSISIPDVKDHEDCGRWRSYDLEAEGSTLSELLDSAIYWQTDQDGGSLGDVRADDNRAIELITEAFDRWIETRGGCK